MLTSLLFPWINWPPPCLSLIFVASCHIILCYDLYSHTFGFIPSLGLLCVTRLLSFPFSRSVHT
ncbi:hypothetical protein BJ742DRAFT_809355 [Cladochytrium replicatum]|nr:hypothetical protein BJ742DRAFT_809355 [Cladochytrium replicatum]